ncbi:MAG: thioesterase domain-containing protein, partial [Marmoricola sp.]
VFGLAGCPDELRTQPELLSLVLPALRADFAAACGYQAPDHPPLDCPLTVMGGSSDPSVDTQGLVAWGGVTVGQHEVLLFPGGHFYLRESAAPLASVTRRLHNILCDLPPLLSLVDEEATA